MGKKRLLLILLLLLSLIGGFLGGYFLAEKPVQVQYLTASDSNKIIQMIADEFANQLKEDGFEISTSQTWKSGEFYFKIVRYDLFIAFARENGITTINRSTLTNFSGIEKVYFWYLIETASGPTATVLEVW